MGKWSVSAQGHAAVQVSAGNWLVALGRGVEAFGHTERLTRLACEVLPNGTVIARDVENGTGYVVHEAIPTGVPAAQEDALDEIPLEALRELHPDEDLGFRILRAPTVLQACQTALSMARAAVGAEAGAVVLRQRGQLLFAAVHGPTAQRLTGVRLPLGRGLVGFAMANQRSVILADAGADPRHWGAVDAWTGYRTRDMAVIPLVHGTVVLGALEIVNTGAGRGLEERDLETLHPLADALSLRLTR